MAADVVANDGNFHARGIPKADLYAAASSYAPMAYEHLKNFLRDEVVTDRFDNGRRLHIDHQANREFNSNTDVLSVLWQHGLVGVGNGPLESEEINFYTLQDGAADDLLLPRDRDFYALHSCLIDSTGVVPTGPPVYPHRRPLPPMEQH
jgi:hypothetical protein